MSRLPLAHLQRSQTRSRRVLAGVQVLLKERHLVASPYYPWFLDRRSTITDGSGVDVRGRLRLVSAGRGDSGDFPGRVVITQWLTSTPLGPHADVAVRGFKSRVCRIRGSSHLYGRIVRDESLVGTSYS
jgi:hypothetical protein